MDLDAVEAGGQFWAGAGGALLGGLISVALALAVFVLTRRHDECMHRRRHHVEAVDVVLAELMSLQDALGRPDDGHPPDNARLETSRNDYSRVLTEQMPRIITVTTQEVLYGVDNALMQLLHPEVRSVRGEIADRSAFIGRVRDHVDSVNRWLPETRWEETFTWVPRYPMIDDPDDEPAVYEYRPRTHNPRRDSALGSEWPKVVKRFDREQRLAWFDGLRARIWRRLGIRQSLDDSEWDKRYR